MENDKAKIIISVSEGKFEISGSEKFVSTQIENFKDLIIKSVNRLQTAPKAKSEDQQHSDIPESSSSSSPDILDPDIFVEDEELIKIICDLPGKGKAEQTLNAALLYAQARTLQGQETANVEEIRTICSDHGCLDKTNFSSHVKKRDPQYFIDKGSGKSRTIKLNRPGQKKAKVLIESIKQSISA